MVLGPDGDGRAVVSLDVDARLADAFADDKCPRCGGPMEEVAAFVCGPGSPGRLALPPTCPSIECQRARDEAAVSDMIARGVIDP